ncbi:MAG: M28 family peptidase, partial [Desulfurococcales archaeon]|nr:M28 family peptidase [Desulfurococcales archaeon]
LTDYTGLEYRLIEIPVLSWKLKHKDPPWLQPAPYTEESYARGRVTRVKGDPGDPGAWSRGRGIALIREPEDPDDLKAAMLLAFENGFDALLVEAPPRIIVVNGYWGYSYRAGAPAPIPVGYVEPGRVREGEVVEVSVDADMRTSRGYIVEAGGGENPVAVGAHYDRWYTGFQDNILGVAQAGVLARMLLDKGGEVLLLAFTAEEHGAPGYASWYWAWGSRFYFTQLEESGRLEGMRAYINFDVAGNRGLTVSGSPQLISGTRLPVREWECPECDSLQAAVRGVPTISIHSLWSGEVLKIYHTPHDTPSNYNIESAAEAVLEAYRLISMEPRWGALREVLGNTLSRGPLEARRLNAVIQALLDRDPEHGYRILSRTLLKPVHYGSYRHDSGHLEALWVPEASLLDRIMRGYSRGSLPREVIEPGEERLLLVLSNGRRNVRLDQVMAQVRRAIIEYTEEIQAQART